MKNIIIYKVLKFNLSLAIIALTLGAIYRIIQDPNPSLKLINIGILLIIISPILRILLELIFFVKEKNTYMYLFV
ncbi:hypothetical protein fh0823_08780 [Francisella halioticida]|nr:hypothetical protein fh0823_08780 [Francisella halioticida]